LLISSVLNPQSPEVWRKTAGEKEFWVSAGASQSGGLCAKARVYWGFLRACKATEDFGRGRVGGGRGAGFQPSLAELQATSQLFNQFTSRRRTDLPNAAPIIRESPSTSGSRGFEDPLTTEELNNALLAAKALQHDADLVLRRKIPPRRAADVLHKLFRWLLQQPWRIATVSQALTPEPLKFGWRILRGTQPS
jgi:hypothetical protein